MKLLFTLSMCIFFTTILAQTGKKMRTDVKNIIKLGVNTHFVGDEFPLGIAWETKVGSRQSLQFGFTPRYSEYNSAKTSGIGLQLAFRNYIAKGKQGIQGLYIAPQVRYGKLNETYSYNNQKGTTENINAAFLFGQHWIYKSGLSLDLSAGFGYYKNNYSNSYSWRSFNKEGGIGPNFHFTLGYAF